MSKNLISAGLRLLLLILAVGAPALAFPVFLVAFVEWSFHFAEWSIYSRMVVSIVWFAEAGLFFYLLL